MRHRVNDLLDWRGVPAIPKGGKRRRITLVDILRTLEPINEGRNKRDRITYDCLWVHAKRHYDIEGIAAYWEAQVHKKLRKAVGGSA